MIYNYNVPEGKTICLLSTLLSFTLSRPLERISVIYASRTHSQLSKVVKEFRSTIYSKKVKMSILGSRNQLCIHPKISNIKNSLQQNQACRQATNKHSCKYYENVSSFTANYNSSNSPSSSSSSLDIEDLNTIGRDHEVCPFYLSREFVPNSALLLMPYNYLVDPDIRNRLQLNLENSILVFDESHNLESVCNEAASFDLTSHDIAQAIMETQKCIEIVQESQDSSISSSSTVPSYIDMLMSGSGLSVPSKVDLPSLTTLKGLLLDFEGLLMNHSLCTRDGPYIFDILNECKINFRSKTFLINVIEKSVEILFAGDDNGGKNPHSNSDSQKKNCALDKINSCLKLIFKGSDDDGLLLSREYKVHFQVGKSNSANKILSYWCFSPGVAMKQLTQNNHIRSIIFTSGTLAPLDSFTQEVIIKTSPC